MLTYETQIYIIHITGSRFRDGGVRAVIRRNETADQGRTGTAAQGRLGSVEIGVLPTLDCLPIYVAKERSMFDAAKADIRLVTFMSQIDCDEALKRGRIEGNVTDLVRGQHIKSQGMTLDYVTATNTYWQLISNRLARIRRLSQLDDKMLAMTRFSATALLADYAVDSAKLNRDMVFKIQINDVALRLQMLLNNEMDAVLLPEPQATTARLYKNPVLMDSRDKDVKLGVIAFNSKAMKDNRRQEQLKEFIKDTTQRAIQSTSTA